MNPQTCAIVRLSGHCLHITPYRARRNSAAVRLELPAQGRAREDPRPGAHVSTVHRPPFQTVIHSRTNGVRITRTRATQEGPAPTQEQQHHSRSGKAHEKSRGRALPLGTRCREPSMGSAKVAPAPAPHGRHGMAAVAGLAGKALAGLPLTGPARRWQAVSDSTAPCQCLAVWC